MKAFIIYLFVGILPALLVVLISIVKAVLIVKAVHYEPKQVQLFLVPCQHQCTQR